MSTVIGNLRVVLGLDAAAFQKGMADATAGLKKVGQDMQRIGRTMSVAVTAPLAGFGALSIRTAANFETAMNRVRAVSGATGDELEALTKQARDLGATTQFSASDAADAMGFLAMAGYDTTQIMAAMPDTLRLASAAQLDMADAADIVTNILAGYGLEVDELAHANDVLVKSFTSANTDLRQLGEAMKYAGPVASAAGVEFEEAAAALALMGNAGIQGSMAGTSLRGAISRILSPTKAMKTRMEEAGLAFTDAKGRILPLADIIEQLEPHAEDAGLMMELFGQRAGPAMAALVSQGADSVRDLTGELRDSAGTAEKISKVQMEGFNGAIKELQSAFEELQIAVASSGLIDAVRQFVLWLTELVKWMGQLSPETLKWATMLAAVAAALGPVLAGVGMMLIGIGPLLTGLGALATVAAGVSAPFLAAAAAIAAAGTAIYANWDTVGPWLGQLIESLKTILTGFAEMVKGVFTGDMQTAVDGLKTMWQGFADFWRIKWAGMVGVLNWAWESAIRPVLENLGALDGIVAAWEALSAGIEAVLNDLGARFDAFMSRIQPVINALQFVQSGGLGDALNSVTGGNKGPISGGAYTGGATGPIPIPSDAMQQGLSSGTSGIAEQGAKDARGYIDNFNDEFGIQSPSKVMEEAGHYIMQGLSSGIMQQQPQIAAQTEGFADTLKNSIKGALEGIIRGTMSVKEAFAAMLQDMASRLLSSGLDKLMSSIFGMGGGGGDPLAAALRAIIPGFATGGMHRGGYRIVGEHGPELEATGSARYFSAHKTASMLGGSRDMNIHVTASFDETGNLYVKRVAQQEAASMGAQIHQSLPQQVAAIRRDPRARRG